MSLSEALKEFKGGKGLFNYLICKDCIYFESPNMCKYKRIETCKECKACEFYKK